MVKHCSVKYAASHTFRELRQLDQAFAALRIREAAKAARYAENNDPPADVEMDRATDPRALDQPE
jgi:hypothetical protein